MVEIFKVLGDETRLRILAQILKEEMCVCEIEACLDLTQSNASRHLTILKRAGILLSYKKAQWVYYKINGAFINKHALLFEYLSEEVKKLSCYDGDCEKLEIFKQEKA